MSFCDSSDKNAIIRNCIKLKTEVSSNDNLCPKFLNVLKLLTFEHENKLFS